MRTAFRDLHGGRLHGFALLVTLGDRARAAAAAAAALELGQERVQELRHPERAAAWLRREVVRALRRNPRREGTGPTFDERHAVLSALGVAPGAFEGLAALELRQRTALVAAEIEGLDARDVEMILGRDHAGARRLVLDARRRYLEAAAEAVAATRESTTPGPLALRISQMAAMAVGRQPEAPE